MKLQFMGATREVTGSKHLITTKSGLRILLDCGMYQGKGLETDLTISFFLMHISTIAA